MAKRSKAKAKGGFVNVSLHFTAEELAALEQEARSKYVSFTVLVRQKLFIKPDQAK